MAQGIQHEPTDENRKLVRSLAAVGTKYEDIALKLKISSDTLVKYYKPELDDGRIDANAAIAQSLFQAAKTGNTSAQMFWLKTRAGWKETMQHEVTGANGSNLGITVEFVKPKPKDEPSTVS
jgi:hypothetical protein